jgi:integrase/TM2 domain-containing membrane protein YozV
MFELMLMQGMTENQRLLFATEMNGKRKSKTVALLLTFFLGWMGGHRFYLDQTGWGLVYLCLFWTSIPMFVSLVELFLVGQRVEWYNDKRRNRDCDQAEDAQHAGGDIRPGELRRVTVYLPKGYRSWRYDFWLFGRRYQGSTGLLTKDEAQEFEVALKKKIRRRRAGLEAADASDTPLFSTWAAVTFRHHTQRKKLKRPEQLKTNLRMAMGFWGDRPVKNAVEDAPYKSLRLGDPIANPELLEEFEQWMDGRGMSGSRKNHYRSACSVMYKLALQPAFRKKSQIRENPFEHIPRDRVPKRIRVYTAAQLRAIIEHAAWHVRIAVAIGALAPKLRLRNVLDLRWSEHVAPDLSQISDPDHKTDQETGLPLVILVSSELRKVLEVAKKHRRGAYVVHYHGRHVRDIKTGLKHAVARAAKTLNDKSLIWGRAKGVTYHSLRHTMATELARMGIPEALRTRVMGWRDPSTAPIYTHMVPIDEVAPLEELGRRMPLADVIGVPKQLWGRSKGADENRSGNSLKRRRTRSTAADRRKEESE